jgi:hypothetical protein
MGMTVRYTYVYEIRKVTPLKWYAILIEIFVYFQEFRMYFLKELLKININENTIAG